jgi:predicted RNA-binding Zn ribbon-like protein
VATDRDDRRLAAPGDLELIRDFINTLDVLPDTGKIGDPASLASWLAEHGLVPTQPTLTEEDLERARSLREALRGLLLANAGFPLAPEAAEAFDDAVGSARFRVRANEAGRLELLPTDAGGLEDTVGGLASIVLAAQQGGTWPRLKACAECHWALYDLTKNRSAAWCGSQCGARVRARRHWRRRREEYA